MIVLEDYEENDLSKFLNIKRLFLWILIFISILLFSFLFHTHFNI